MELLEKTMLWESTKEPKEPNESPSSSSKGMHLVGNFIATEAELAVLIRILEALETSSAPSQMSMNPNYNSSNHKIEHCHELEQVNAMFQPRPMNDPFAPTYNPVWKNHPNFS